MKDSLSEQLVHAMMTLRKLRGIMPISGEVSHGEFRMLGDIAFLLKKDHSSKGIAVSRINDKACMSMPAVSQILRSLEKKNLIQRTVAEEDRRMILVSITKEGYELLKHLNVKMRSALDRLIFQLGEADTKQLIHLIKRLTTILKEIQKEDDEI